MFKSIADMLEKNYMKKLVFLTMLFGVMIVATGSVSAQNVCSKDMDGKEIKIEVANATRTPFTINWVDQNCKEHPSNDRIPNSGDNIIYKDTSYGGYVFRIREVGTKKLIQTLVVDPSKEIAIIYDNSDGGIRYFSKGKEQSPSTPNPQTTSENSSASANTDSDCSKTLSKKPVNIKWVNKTGTVMVVYWIDYDCNEKGGFEVNPGDAYQDTSYAGHVFRIVKGAQSDEPGSELITVGHSTAFKNITWSR